MNKKSILVIFASLFCAWVLFSGVVSISFEKMGENSPGEIISFDNNVINTVALQDFFSGFSKEVRRNVGDVFKYLGEMQTVQSCREQPVVFGALFIFFGMAIFSVAFVVHLIVSDTRLS